MTKIKKVIFPVAGMGTRFLPATKAVPKEMLPVIDKPLIQWAVEEAREAGIDEFIFVSSPEKKAIMQHFSPAPAYEKMLKAKGKTHELKLLKAGLPPDATLIEIYQPEPLGLGHAIWCAREAIGNDPFAVILPDDMVLAQTGCLKQMVEQYEGGNLVAIEEVPRDQTSRYGVLDPDTSFTHETLVKIKSLVEKPDPANAPSNLAIIGRYILDPAIMRQLDNPRKGVGGEIQITDAMDDLIGHIPMHGLRFTGKRYDCGSKAGYLAANLAYGLKDESIRDALRNQIEDLIK